METKALKDLTNIKEVEVSTEVETIKEGGEEEITGIIRSKITISIIVSKVKANLTKMYIIKIKVKIAVAGDRRNSQKGLK